VDIFDNHNVKLHNIELWSAPWFGFRVFRNSGHLHFDRVNIRPEPNSGNLTSTWRDGFHVKGNRAELLWENCVLEGMNDDAFNISTHSRVITHIFSTQKFKTRQLYPLEPIPWRIGDLMTALDPQTGSIRGSARVISVSAEKSGFNRENAAPFLTIQIDQPIPGLTLEDHLWQPASTNPKTTIKNCIIKQSCRMQSSLTMIGCEVTALLWFYGETIEGPGPQNITLRDCVLRRGRGNPSRALVINGEGINKNSPIRMPRLIENATIKNCEIHGGISIKGADAVTLKHNVFAETNATIELKRNNRLDSAQ
jgi:hypothetical protein